MKPSRSVLLPLAISEIDAKIDPDVWYSHGLRFACTQCGHCCSGGPGYVWLTDDDMQRIANYLKLPLETFTRTYVRKVNGHSRFALTEKFNYDCTFLTRNPEPNKSAVRFIPSAPHNAAPGRSGRTT